MTETTIRVRGMTCENCARHVSDALKAIAGVREVRVDLAQARATIVAEREPTREELARALDDAGYALD
jgi:copper chaperone CopZ